MELLLDVLLWFALNQQVPRCQITFGRSGVAYCYFPREAEREGTALIGACLRKDADSVIPEGRFSPILVVFLSYKPLVSPL